MLGVVFVRVLLDRFYAQLLVRLEAPGALDGGTHVRFDNVGMWSDLTIGCHVGCQSVFLRRQRDPI